MPLNYKYLVSHVRATFSLGADSLFKPKKVTTPRELTQEEKMVRLGISNHRPREFKSQCIEPQAKTKQGFRSFDFETPSTVNHSRNMFNIYLSPNSRFFLSPERQNLTCSKDFNQKEIIS